MPATFAPQIAAIGELLWDKFPGGARLGGAPANFAVMAARLGNRATLISSVGKDAYGEAAIGILSQPNLDLGQLQTSVFHPTGTVDVAFLQGGQPNYTIATDVAWDFMEATPQFLRGASTADAVCFGTLGQRCEQSRAAIRSFVEAAPPQCARVCDVNLRMPFCTPEVLHWSLAHATLLKISEEELPAVFALLQIAGAPAPSTPRQAADFLLDRFQECKLVAFTLGAHGCLLTARSESAQHPGFPIRLVDTVGAGDAFTAGLVHAYLRNAPLAGMAAVGNLCGSYVASQPGATPPLEDGLIERIAILLANAPA